MKTKLIYLASVNLLTFLLFAVDKYKAVKRKWRIRESFLLLFSVFGGSAGGIISMQMFRHKTQTPIFKYGMPFVLLLQIAVAIFLLKG